MWTARLVEAAGGGLGDGGVGREAMLARRSTACGSEQARDGLAEDQV